jgi:hypothetical protein
VTAAISPRLCLIGVPVLALPDVIKAWHRLRSPEEQVDYAERAETRLSYTARDLGLAGFLAIMCGQLHPDLPRTHRAEEPESPCRSSGLRTPRAPFAITCV